MHLDRSHLYGNRWMDQFCYNLKFWVRVMYEKWDLRVMCDNGWNKLATRLVKQDCATLLLFMS